MLVSELTVESQFQSTRPVRDATLREADYFGCH